MLMAVNTEFFLKEAWLSMRRGGLMSLAAFVIVFISLVMLGIFLLILFNLNMLMGSLGDKMEIMAYTDINFTRAGAENLKNQITQINGVARVEFIPKENAWAAFKEDFSNINLGNMLDTNPLPDAFKVKTEKIEMIPHISQTIQALSGIEDVRYGGETAKRIKIFSIVVRWIGFGIISVMIIATLLIVVNTIRLTVLARKDDIYIMRLVGATSSFVRWPFILEGV
ncbi:MAG: ABC transporter permease, partial [Candidatus Margulisbacteria bacterium]|nr:ABC transporter permease [Candidatus Margulisiibacteriota bacterium]